MQIRRTALVGSLILILSMLALNPQMMKVQSYVNNRTSVSYSPMLLADDNLNNISQDITLKTYVTDQVVSGLNYVTMMRNEITPGDPATFDNVGIGTTVFDMEGNIVNYFNTSRNLFGIPYNSTTMIIDKGSTIDNLTLFNLYTGKEEILPIPGNVLDIVYNPNTQTFLVLDTVASVETWDGLQVSYQNILEYYQNGSLAWEWDASTYLPFNSATHTSLGYNATFNGYADWMHANSLVWNFDDDEVLLLVSNHDTIYNINKTGSEILWSAGRLGSFNVTNSSDVTVDTIWWHPYDLEPLGGNRYIVFDNDARNITNPDSLALLDGYSRLLEFSIDVAAEKIKEEWAFIAPDSSYYSPTAGGDSDRLPNGNTLGIFGNRGESAILLNNTHPIFYTEVNSAGEIVWEIEMSNSTQFAYQSYNIERFYETPFIDLETDTFLLKSGFRIELNLQTWDCMRYTYDTSAVLRILDGEEQLFNHEFDFLAFWEPNEISLELTGLGTGEHNLILQVENVDGLIGSVDLTIVIELNVGLLVGVLASSGILIVATSAMFVKKVFDARKTETIDQEESIPVETEETI